MIIERAIPYTRVDLIDVAFNGLLFGALVMIGVLGFLVVL